MIPESLIYTSKQNYKHPWHFHMGVHLGLVAPLYWLWFSILQVGKIFLPTCGLWLASWSYPFKITHCVLQEYGVLLHCHIIKIVPLLTKLVQSHMGITWPVSNHLNSWSEKPIYLNFCDRKWLDVLLLCPYRMLRDAAASWLVCSSPEQAVRVRALTGDTVLCSWARH